MEKAGRSSKSIMNRGEIMAPSHAEAALVVAVPRDVDVTVEDTNRRGDGTVRDVRTEMLVSEALGAALKTRGYAPVIVVGTAAELRIVCTELETERYTAITLSVSIANRQYPQHLPVGNDSEAEAVDVTGATVSPASESGNTDAF